MSRAGLEWTGAAAAGAELPRKRTDRAVAGDGTRAGAAVPPPREPSWRRTGAGGRWPTPGGQFGAPGGSAPRQKQIFVTAPGPGRPARWR